MFLDIFRIQQILLFFLFLNTFASRWKVFKNSHFTHAGRQNKERVSKMEKRQNPLNTKGFQKQEKQPNPSN